MVEKTTEEIAEKIAEIIIAKIREDCIKYPWLPRCRIFASGIDVKELGDPKHSEVVERGFERLEQALETGVVSKQKIPKAITQEEFEFHMSNKDCPQSANVLRSVYNGKTRVLSHDL